MVLPAHNTSTLGVETHNVTYRDIPKQEGLLGLSLSALIGSKILIIKLNPSPAARRWQHRYVHASSGLSF